MPKPFDDFMRAKKAVYGTLASPVPKQVTLEKRIAALVDTIPKGQKYQDLTEKGKSVDELQTAALKLAKTLCESQIAESAYHAHASGLSLPRKAWNHVRGKTHQKHREQMEDLLQSISEIWWQAHRLSQTSQEAADSAGGTQTNTMDTQEDRAELHRTVAPVSGTTSPDNGSWSSGRSSQDTVVDACGISPSPSSLDLADGVPSTD